MSDGKGTDSKYTTNDLLKPLAAHPATTMATTMASSSLKAPILISSASSPSIMSMGAAHSASDHLFKAAAVSAANKQATGHGGLLENPTMSFQSSQVSPPAASAAATTISSQLTSAASATPLDSSLSSWIRSTTSPRTSPFLGRRTPQFFIPDNMIDNQLDRVLEQSTSSTTNTETTSSNSNHHGRSNLASRLGQLSELNLASAYQRNNSSNNPTTNLLAPPNNSGASIARNKSYHGLSGQYMFVAPAPVGPPATAAEQLRKSDEPKPSTTAGSSAAAVNQSNAKAPSKGTSKPSFRFDVANFDINAVGPSSW